MPAVQFENDLKRLMSRYKQPLDKDTQKAFVKMDKLAKQIADKATPPKELSSLVNKLKDANKKLIKLIKEDLDERLKEVNQLKNKKDPAEPAARKVYLNVQREMGILQKKAKVFAEGGGKAPPPPKLPEFHFGADYKKIILEHDGTLSPAVVSELDKLDENSDAERAVKLIDAVCAALEKQVATVLAAAQQSKDQKEKSNLAGLGKDLTEFRKMLKELGKRIFLIHRLKG